MVLGKTDNDLCPVTALLAYLAIRGSGPGFLFLFSDRRPLTKQRFIQRVRQALSAIGVDSSQYAGHSFRIGAATTASARGLSESTIQMLGRWQSSAYQLYIRTMLLPVSLQLSAIYQLTLSLRTVLFVFYFDHYLTPWARFIWRGLCIVTIAIYYSPKVVLTTSYIMYFSLL